MSIDKDKPRPARHCPLLHEPFPEYRWSKGLNGMSIKASNLVALLLVLS